MAVRELICEIKENEDIDWTKDFIEEGIFDSLEIMKLVEMLEQFYECKIDVMEIVPENFSSLKNIESMVLRNGGNL